MATSLGTKPARPVHGIIVFIITLVILLFGGGFIQAKLGMIGVALTEVIILLLAIIPALIMRKDFREVFPFKRPTVRQVFGTIIIWIGSFLAIILVTLILTYFFPKGLTQVSSSLQNTITSVPAIISFLIVAVMPAICEEALHRGFIQNSFSNLKNKWAIVAIMGLIFGIFHLDPYRFLPTGLLGVALSYLMVETNNLIYPMLFHLVNNSISTLSSFAFSPQDIAQSSSVEPKLMLASIGMFFIIGCVAPLLLMLGSHLIREKKPVAEEDWHAERVKRSRAWLITVLCTVIMFALGSVIIFFSQR